MKHYNLTRCPPAAIVVLAGTTQALAGGLLSVFELSSLNGANGFVINGIDPGDANGSSGPSQRSLSVSSAGDINGDGIDDLVIGALGADQPGANPYASAYNAGESYVVFGSAAPFPAALNLSALNGTNGFIINGIGASDYSGASVSAAGDINGDGIDDLIIGAYGVRPNIYSSTGESYIVFGSVAPFPAALELSSLNGANGFAINGINVVDHNSGWSVSAAGDINGDGVDDLIIGGPYADPGQSTGKSYVVFGSAGPFPAALNLAALNGANGFIINGIDPGDFSGKSVSAAGDINGDGIDDLIIAAPGADPAGLYNAGECYVIFGSVTPFPAAFNLAALNGTNGFTIDGSPLSSTIGWNSISVAGDINGDSIDDLVIGASEASPNGQLFAGMSYVVFGSAAPFPAALELSSLNGVNGFIINGINENERSGWSVSAAGDFNGDGVDDLVIGAFGAYPNGASAAGAAGKTYVVFGSTSPFPAALDFAALNGANGFTLNGIDAGDQSGKSVSGAGDINGDGVDDLIIAAPGANGSIGFSQSIGESYVVFGGVLQSCPSDLNNDGDVDTADLGILVSQFNTPGPGADINGDGTVDTADLGILVGAFGTTTCP